MEIIIEKSDNGKPQIKAILNGKEFKWGKKLSETLTSISFANSDGVCEFSLIPLEFVIAKNGVEFKCILPPLSIFQTDEEFATNFKERVRIVKDSIKKLDNCLDRRIIEIDI